MVGDVVQWTVMLLGYIEHDKNEDATQLYLQMLVQGLLPNMMTFSGMLKACGNMGDIQKGNNFHVQMSSQNMEVTETSALIEKYA